MQLKPVATATPDGNVRIARSYRWIPALVLMEIELIEQEHRELVAETADRLERQLLEMRIAAYYDLHGIPGRHPVTVSSRQAVILEVGELSRRNNRRIDRRRAHERAKTRRRDRQTIRQLPLAA